MRFLAVQKFWKSVKIWQSYREFKGELFLDTVYMILKPKFLEPEVEVGIRY